MRDNIQSKLAELNIKSDKQKQYIVDIFGQQIGESKIPGLVDCMSPEAFDLKLTEIADLWTNRHPKGEQFLEYFRKNKANLIKKCMTADVRAFSGLGFPPKMYNQNANECANSVIKRGCSFSKITIPQCIKHLEQIV